MGENTLTTTTTTTTTTNQGTKPKETNSKRPIQTCGTAIGHGAQTNPTPVYKPAAILLNAVRVGHMPVSDQSKRVRQVM